MRQLMDMLLERAVAQLRNRLVLFVSPVLRSVQLCHCLKSSFVVVQSGHNKRKVVLLEIPCCQVLRHGGHGAIYRGSQVTGSV